MAIASIGDINRGGFEVIVISKRIKIVPNLDKIAHMGGGL
jgi:hypothetical protein